MGYFKSLYGAGGYVQDFIYSYRVYAYNAIHDFDTEKEANSFVEECEQKGMEVDLFEVQSEELEFDNEESYDFISSDEVETLITY